MLYGVKDIRIVVDDGEVSYVGSFYGSASALRCREIKEHPLVQALAKALQEATTASESRRSAASSSGPCPPV